MENRIQSVQIEVERLSPAEVELWFIVTTERVTATTAIRGRLMGPRCRYASTVEVAYPMRERSRRNDEDFGVGLTLRVVIPEPNFWEPEHPFFYEGPLELWQDGWRCDERWMSRSFRQLRLNAGGLVLNGRPLRLRCSARAEFAEDDLLSLRAQGNNAVLTPVTNQTEALWEAAGRGGFLMLSRVNSAHEILASTMWKERPSYLGCVLDPAVLQENPLWAGTGVIPFLADNDSLLGVELKQKPSAPLPSGIQFVVCEEQLLPEIKDLELPKLVVSGKRLPDNEVAEETAPVPGILGWIYS
jgi:hypothetical protein